MKKLLFVLLALILSAGVVIGLIYAYKVMRAARAAEGSADKAIATASRVKRSTNGESLVVFDAETRQRVGVASTVLSTATITKETCAYGKVVDVSALAPFYTELQTSDIAIEFARKGLARVKQLYAQGENASLRSVEAVEAELQKNLAARQGIKDRLAITWGTTIAEQPDLGVFLRSFIDAQNALVRLDLMPGETVAAAPPRVRISLQAGESNAVEGTRFEVPIPVYSSLPVQSFVYLVKGTKWAPGTKVIGWIKHAGEDLSGVLLPHRAVVRTSGQGWAYVQQAEDTFVRRRVALDHPAEGGWLVTEGWQPGERVVTTGAQTLLSEELKAQIKLLE